MNAITVMPVIGCVVCIVVLFSFAAGSCKPLDSFNCSSIFGGACIFKRAVSLLRYYSSSYCQ